MKFSDDRQQGMGGLESYNQWGLGSASKLNEAGRLQKGGLGPPGT